MARVVHFEISANDPEKVISFYKDVFDWNVTKWDGPEDYWLVRTGDEEAPGINGGIFRPNGHMTGTVNTIDVADIHAQLERVKQHGGEVVTDVMTIPEMGYLAYCKDVEGTLFGLVQMDPSVKG